MTPYDEGLIIGIIIGSALTGALASLLWIIRDRVQGPMPLNEDWPEDDK